MMPLDPLEALWCDRMPVEHPMPQRAPRVRYAKPAKPVLRHAGTGVGKLPPLEDQASTGHDWQTDSLPSWA